MKHRVDSRSGNGATRAGLEAGRARDLVGAGDPRRRSCLRPAAIFARVGAPVARDEREHRAAVADEDERLDDLAELAADGAAAASCAVGVPSGNSSMRASAPAVAQERGDALDGFRPGAASATRTG